MRYLSRAQRRLNSLPAGTRRSLVGWLLVGLLVYSGKPAGGAPANAVSKHDHALSYSNDVIARVPWSVHIVKIDRSRSDLRFCTTSGKGDFLGMGTVSDQLKTLPPDLEPLAAINGDFYEKGEDYEGRPRDVQIRRGEILSTPAGHTCFWIDPRGELRMTNIFSRFRVVWPAGVTTPVGLNERRAEDAAVLYTAAAGKSTRTVGGMELVLEPATNGPWLPLRPAMTYDARVRECRNAGDTPLDKDALILSIGPKFSAPLPVIQPGAALKVFTETVPDLSGVEVAIGGGPALVRDGKLMHWDGTLHMRHPRTALGWNKDHLFLVEVDGRQLDVSLGMSFPELADYMLKLGCEQAMNLDGGGSATLWAFGTVRNSPSEGQERPAANALVVVRKRTQTQN